MTQVIFFTLKRISADYQNSPSGTQISVASIHKWYDNAISHAIIKLGSDPLCQEHLTLIRVPSESYTKG